MPRLNSPWRPIVRRYPERNPADPLAGFIGCLFKDRESDPIERGLVRLVIYLLALLLVVQVWRAFTGGAA